MKKYYVTSGNCEKVLQSRNAETAAIWGMHQFLDSMVDLESIDWLDEAQIDNFDLLEALMELGEEVRVSERGFGRCEAGNFDTGDVMTRWQQLLVAVCRLNETLDEMSE